MIRESPMRRCVELFSRARERGMLASDAGLEWVRRVYYALIGEAQHGGDPAPAPSSTPAASSTPDRGR